MALLELESLAVSYASRGRRVEAVRGVSLGIGAQECVAVVGESGAGKSQLFLASLGLLPAEAEVNGRVRFEGEEMSGAGRGRLERLRGAALAMVFQDAAGALTPHLRIGVQLAEVLVVHRAASWRAARAAALEALARVGIGAPQLIIDRYPHELSGGQCQRVALAMALIGAPRLLIADEPTSALDVTVQAQILALLESLRADGDLALVLISHDLAVVARLAERIVVMYAGAIVESAAVASMLEAPRHPYTALLLECAPRTLAVPPRRMPFIPGVPARADTALPGCAFAPRCPRAAERCHREAPALAPHAQGAVACHYPLR